MNTKMNQRRLVTIAKIESAFLSQFQRKTIREITVTDICEQAEINRCTFYENYDGISDLAKSICRQIEKTASQMPHENGEYAWLFEYVLMHKSVFDVYFKIGAPLESDDYRSAYLRNGIYAVVKAWYKAGCQESAEEIDQLLKRIICQRVRDAY